MTTFRLQFLTAFATCLLSISSAFSHGQGDDDLGRIVYLTEDYPPANFIKSGKLSGYSVDILKAAANEMGDDIDKGHVVLQAWADAYRTVLTTENTAIFSMARTDHREELFQWVGPITDVKVVVMVKKDSSIVINAPLEMAKYKIGVIRDDVGEQALLDLGVPRGAMYEATDVAVLAELLLKNRIDMIAYSERTAYWYAAQAGFSSDMFKPIYTLKEGHTYYAFNKDTDPVLIKKLQQGLDKIKARINEDGVSQYQAILNQYR
ncbi:ABC transporter substrate-binding protein [uncultured Vibrio sp.]|uniref:substrate-binding periplasmic protein n=1 Tax=uncultured Vibrio sp. TaxID=114054 RepID=UPI0025F37EA1|nr:transporter substrate-binding domain-containing protein [uncultured Vibrio sp.]